jgi:hypothetical protein
VAATLAVLAPAALAYAEDPTPTAGPGAEEEAGDPNLGPATAGEASCTVSNTSLTLASGMVATENGILVVESRDTVSLQVFTLDDSCKVTTKAFSSANPLEPQDMAVGADGVWIGDIGSSEAERTTVAVWKVEGSKATIHRMDYPSSGKFNAEAMLLDKGDVPIIISNEGGKGVMYKPDGELIPDTRTGLPKLEKVGEFTPEKTGTENPASIVGNASVTGAAKSPDGTKVVIRTASDAYEFVVGEDGDVVKAITEGTPVITPLPNETNGKAITYSADGTAFLTLTATSKPKLLSYKPFVPAPPDDGGEGGENLPDAPAEQGWLQKLSFSELTRIVAAVGVVGLVLAIAGIVGIRRARKRRREEEEDEYDDYDEPRGRRRGRGRDDDDGFGGYRDPGYDDGYNQQYGYAGAGYGTNGYEGGNGYADYGAAEGAAGYGQNGYSAGQYGAQPEYDPYAGQAYGGDYGGQYAAPQQYGGDYSGQYGAPQQYGGEYGGQQYGADYGAQQYGAQQYGAAQQYGSGYGYEDDFDPMQDPRRR